MKKKFDSVDKKKYLAPVLIEYGTIGSITKGGGPGNLSDSFSPPINAFSNDAV